MRNVEITLVANAGLLIECSGGKLLLDGLHNQDCGMFSRVPPAIENQIMQQVPPFDGIRWVVFTHFHEDHFGLEPVNRYLETAEPEMLIIPEDGQYNIPAGIKPGTCQVRLVRVPAGQCQEIKLWDTGSLIAFPAKHAGKEYEKVSHLCYVLLFSGKKILILGDADYDREFLGRMAGGEVFDAVIANPLFLHLPRGRKVFTQSIRTKEIVFCHLPFEEDDQIHFRNMISEDIKRYKEILPPMRALTEPLQKVSI